MPSSKLHLPIINDGHIDAFVTWFELHLDSEVSFSTGPSTNSSWEQAIFPQYDLSVSKGQYLNVDMTCTDNHLLVNTSTTECKCTGPLGIFYIERNELRALNDIIYVQTILRSLTSLLSVDTEWLLLDLMSLPIFSLLTSEQIDFILLGNCQPYYKTLIQTIIDSNGLQDKTSISSLTPAVTWDIVLYDIITPQGTLDTQSIQLLQLVR